MKKLIITTIALMSVSAVSAENISGKFSLTISTMGPGVEYTHPINESFAVRAGLSGISVEDTTMERSIEYNTSFTAQNTHMLFDYHVGGSIFRMSTGVFNMNNVLSLSAISNDSIIIGQTTFNGSDIGSLDGTFSFKGTVPYVGLGLAQSPASDSSLGMSIDIGLVSAPSITGSLDFVCADNPSAPAICNEISSEIENENALLQAEFDKQAKDLKFLPVISAGLSYKF